MSDFDWIEDIDTTYVRIKRGKYVSVGTKFLVNSDSRGVMSGSSETLIIEITDIDKKNKRVEYYTTSTSPRYHHSTFDSDFKSLKTLVKKNYYQPYTGEHL